MKRSRMSDRATPLRPSPMPPRETPLASSGPIKAKRRDTGPTKAVRDIVKERAGYRCEMCPYPGMDTHHRRPRALGGSSDPATNLPSNLVYLCRECHSWIESNRERAQLAGWLVRQGDDPAVVVLWMRGRRVLLTDDGGYIEVGMPLSDYQDTQEAS